MQSIAAVSKSLERTRDDLEATMPGSFVKYDPVWKKSSRIALASDSGVILKTKKRRPEKALYEFLALEIWNRVLEEYSGVNDLRFRAPMPIALTDLDSDRSSILMSFINGYEIQKIGNMRRSTPVTIRNQRYPIPLFPACALHLGALNRLKEQEGLYHSDYSNRHLIFSPISNVSIAVVDVENSRTDLSGLVVEESYKIQSEFETVTSSPKDLEVLKTWYQQGQESLVVPPKGKVLERAVEAVSKKYDLDLDFKNMIINGYHLTTNYSPK